MEPAGGDEIRAATAALELAINNLLHVTGMATESIATGWVLPVHTEDIASAGSHYCEIRSPNLSEVERMGLLALASERHHANGLGEAL